MRGLILVLAIVGVGVVLGALAAASPDNAWPIVVGGSVTVALVAYSVATRRTGA